MSSIFSQGGLRDQAGHFSALGIPSLISPSHNFLFVSCANVVVLITYRGLLRQVGQLLLLSTFILNN
jgi:hypothetical protein